MTNTSEELKKERARGYSAGYVAGKKSVANKRADTSSIAATRRDRQAFYDSAFIEALTFAMTQSTWTKGINEINTLKERIDLAHDVAEAALKRRKHQA